MKQGIVAMESIFFDAPHSHVSTKGIAIQFAFSFRASVRQRSSLYLHSATLCYLLTIMTEHTIPLSSPSVILITGNMAAGKSTVAQALAARLPKSVHLRGDLFRRMIVNGQAPLTADLSREAAQQLQLRYQIAAEVARRYVGAGFVVVYQDIIIGQALVDAVARFQRCPLFVIVLCPRAEVVAARDRARRKTGYPDAAAVAAFDHVLRVETPRLGYWLDTSDLTVDQTVQAILSNVAQALVSTDCVA